MSEVVGEAVVVVRTDESQVNGPGAGKKAGDGFGKGFIGALKGPVMVAGVAAAGAAIAAKFTEALNLDAGAKKIQAQLGLTEQQSSQAGDVAGALYADNFGASMADVQSAVGTVISSVKGMRDASKADLQAATEAALNYAAVFETDVPTAVDAATRLINSGLAKDSTRAFDLMTRASQRVPASLREPLFEAVDEYSQFFDQVGLGGKEAFNTLVAASDRGQFGIDKAGDAIKEFTIRATDMSTASTDAYKAIGLDASEMANGILAGGGKARAATQEVVDGLLKIKDPAKQANTAIALFGTPLEDLGTKNIPAFLKSLSGAEDALGKVDGATQDAADTMNDTPLVQLQAMWRRLQATLTQLAVKALGPVVDAFGEVGKVVRQLTPVVQRKLVPVFREVSAVFTGDVMPVVREVVRFIAADLIPILVDVATTVAKNLKPVLDALVQTFQTKILPTIAKVVEQIRTQLIPALKPIITTVAQIIGWLYKLASAILGTVLPPLIQFAGFIVSKLVPALVSIITWVAKFIGGLIEVGRAVGTAIAAVGRFASALTTGVARAVSSVVRAIASLPGKITGFLADMTTAGADLIGGLFTGIKNAATGVGGLVGDIASAVKNAVVDSINDVIDSINEAIPDKIPVKGPLPDVNLPNNPIPNLQSGSRGLEQSGFYDVGEVGPERVFLPAGAQVLTAAQTKQHGGGGINYQALAAALASTFVPLLAQQRPISFVLPTGDPEAAAMAAMNRLATVG